MPVTDHPIARTQALVFSFIVIRVALNACDAARPDSQFRGSGSSTGRTTYASNAPILQHGRSQSTMREVFQASPIETPTREQSDGVLVITKVEMDSGSVESLEGVPRLERGVGEAV